MRRTNYAASAIYVSKAFDQASKNSTLDMANDIKEAFHGMLVEEDWMDNATMKAASGKLQEMLIKVAYPEFILNSRKLDNYYDNFSVEETDSYSQMVEKLSRWKIEFDLKRLSKPVDRTEYDFNAAVVNAYYDSTSNSIKFPAAFLQAPFFHHSFPRALNYGGLGATIGHEITHGFDDGGKQFDALGNLRDWWNANTTQKFGERVQCMIDQYGRIEVPCTALKLNGKLTQGDNIADNGGLKLAFRVSPK
ncbi:peptidase family M13 [Cooperia oncophora]